MQTDIPKIVHYVWVGGKPLTPLAKKCIASWHTHLSGYEFKFWNEQNIPMDHPYVQEMYRRKKWAFVSDYVRFWALEREGGIYLDTDMELCKSLDAFTSDGFFVGRSKSGHVESSIIGASPAHPIISAVCRWYDQDREYSIRDTSPRILTRAIRNHGDENVCIYDSSHFHPCDEGEHCSAAMLARAYARHHWAESWVPFARLRKILRRLNILTLLKKVLRNKESEINMERESLIVRAHVASLRSREYSENYIGSGTLFRIKRIVRYPFSYTRFVFCRTLRLNLTVRTRTFFGSYIYVPVSDGDGFLLSNFGTLVGNEEKLMRYLIRTLREDEIFYDVGANYGFYSSLVSSIVPNGEVHIFEPVPEIFWYIKKTFATCINCFKNNVALSDTQGNSYIYSAFSAGVSAVSTLEEKVVEQNEVVHEWKKIPIKIDTLDSYVETHKPPTFLKIDVEGSELGVLRGARETIQAFRPTIAMEVWGGEKGNLFSKPAVDFLLKLGYQVFSIDSEGFLKKNEKQSFENIKTSEEGFDNFIFSYDGDE